MRQLLSDENQDAGDERQDWKQYTGGSEAHAGEADDADKDEINGKQEHTDVFCDHGAIFNGWSWLSRAKRLSAKQTTGKMNLGERGAGNRKGA